MNPFSVIWLDETSSTNDEALSLASAGAASGTVIAARTQTGGRGRRGRTWASPPGNLYCSLLLRPDIAPENRGELAFVAALAMRDAAAAFADPEHLAIKWPNDILLRGRKLGGILIEADHNAVIVGMGINIRHFPENSEFPATSLAEGMGEGEELPSPEALLEVLCKTFARWLLVWETQGFAPVREAWLLHAAGRGREVTVRLENEAISGIFLDVTAEGALMLGMDDNVVRRIAAGSVFFKEEP